MLGAAAAARTAEANGERPQSFQLFPDTYEQARTLGGQHGFEGFEYYCTPRAEHPRSVKRLTWTSVDKMISFDAFRAIDLIAPRPVLLIVGSNAVTSWMGVEAFQKANFPKELHWIDGASHVDLYDKPEYVNPAVKKLTGFFSDTLTPNA
jgi:fermentation-respiration switch protein FrsA (DUF1100 family)